MRCVVLMAAILIAFAGATRAQSPQPPFVAEFNGCIAAILNSASAAPIRRHFPLDAREATIEQLSDEARATVPEIRSIEAVHPQIKACQQRALDQLNAIDPASATVLARLQADAENDMILLVQRKISWGERTRRARDRYLEAQAASAALTADRARHRDEDAAKCRLEAQQAVASDSNARADLDPSFGQNQGPFGALAKTIVGGAARRIAESAFNNCMRAHGWN